MNDSTEKFVDYVDDDIKECAKLLAKLDSSNDDPINYYGYIKTAAQCKAIFSESIKDSHQNTILAIKAICDKFTS